MIRLEAMKMRTLPMFILMTVALAAPSAWPDEPGVVVSNSGYLRVRGKSFRNLDPAGGTISWIEDRTRLEPAITLSEKLKIHVQLDILEYTRFFTGSPVTSSSADLFPFYRDYQPAPASISDSLDRIVSVRRAWFEWESPVGLLEAGRMPSHWGMGILSNDGNGFRNAFGDGYYGDSFDRILFGTKPLGRESDLLTAIAFDKLSTGNIDATSDDADEGILAVLYTAKPVTAGVYVISRNQSSTDTAVWISDAYVKAQPDPLFLEGEAAFINGHTSALPTPLASGRRVVEQLGAAAKVGARFSPLTVSLNAGYASGDGDPLGGKVTQFSFHPDFNVGLIMFEEALAYDTARAVGSFERIQGSLLPGTLNFATRGAVTNAIYVMPSVGYSPVEGLDVLLAFLWARSDQPWVNPYLYVIDQSQGPLNLRGGPLSDDLGWEVDAAVHYAAFKGKLLAGLEGGYFSPGRAFDSDQGRATPISTIQLKLTTVF